jgi:hypothetical protein
MKKMMFALAAVALAFTSAQAQKQLGGEHNIEVNLTPFGDSPIDGTSLKYRNFIDDNAALRLTLHLNSSSDVYTWSQESEINEADPVSPQLHLNTGTTTFGLSAGYEKHFDGTDNLSPYFGIEAYYLMASRNDLIEYWGPNDLDNVGQPDVYVVWNVTNQQTISNYGLNLLFGADYYFNDAIYVGFETGLGFGGTAVGNHTIATSDLTAFNIQFNQAFDPESAGAAIADSFVGELPFDATTMALYDNYFEDGYPAPNHLSNFTLSNVFNASLRFGFLFD